MLTSSPTSVGHHVRAPAVANSPSMRIHQEAEGVARVAAQVHRMNKRWKDWPTITWTPVRLGEGEWVPVEPDEAQSWLLDVVAEVEDA